MDITQVETKIFDSSILDNVFGTGTDDILVAETPSEATNVLQKETTNVLDTAIPTETKPLPIVSKNVEDTLDKVGAETLEIETEEEIKNSTSDKGRPKTDKNALTSYLKGKIEAKEFVTYDDYDETKMNLDEYLSKMPEKDLHELLDTNWSEKEKAIRSSTPKEFFESLPEELQYAAAYVAEGGQDLKGLFRALSHVEEVKSLDPDNEGHQLQIVKSYLQASTKLTSDQIDEQVEDWKDSGKIEKKAKEFKPALDDMQKQQVEYQLTQQREFAKSQQEAAQIYIKNVQEALKDADLGGIKVDKKKQIELYNGLTQANYQSASGRPVNLLGAALEKIQYTEPNYKLLAEATWLLTDPDGYRNAIRQQGKNEQVEKVVKQLKMNQGIPGAVVQLQDNDDKPRRLTRIKNVFEKA